MEAQYVRTDAGNALPPPLFPGLGNGDGRPTVSDLYKKQLQLDHQCLQYARANEDHHIPAETSDVNSAIELAIYLGTPICLARHPGTFLYQEIQLRTWISSIALLHYLQVSALYPEQWDRLKHTDLLQRIAFQLLPDSTLSEKIRWAGNVYMLQLASHYLSFIRRGDSILPYIVGPIARIFWSGLSVAGRQYQNIQQILKGLSELFALWQRPQTKFKALWGLQEYIRLTSAVCREATGQSNPNTSINMINIASIILPALVEKVELLVDAETRTSLPTLRGNWPRLRTLLDLPPPTLNRGYYLYGLLDCAAQLATMADLSVHRQTFLEKIKALIFTSEVREYRWKAIEVLLSFRLNRMQRFCWLNREIEQNCRTSLRDAIIEEAMTIYDLLVYDEEASLRFTDPPPFIYPSDMMSAELDPDVIAPATTNTSSIHSQRTDSLAGVSLLEAEILPSQIISSRSFSVSLAKNGFLNSLLNRICYDFAGLSSYCRYCFFYRQDEVSVFPLDLRVCGTQPFSSRALCIDKRATHGEPIVDAKISLNFLVTITTERVLISNISNKQEFEPILHGNWEPAGLAIHESETLLIIILGYGKGFSLETTDGRIEIYKYRIGSRSRRLACCSSPTLPTRARPKRLSLKEDGRILTCVTAIQSKLLVWELDENFSSSVEPFAFTKNRYRQEQYEVGVTSTSIYISPSNNIYLLCTTSPSSERHQNQGEWSFILPLPNLGKLTAPQLRPPYRDNIHNFEQFENHRAITAGAVSSRHNVFAVLEVNGRISLLPLKASAQGGICGVNTKNKMKDLDESRGSISYTDTRVGMKILDERLGGTGGCLSFTPDGEKLIAVDARGKVVIVDFEKRYFQDT